LSIIGIPPAGGTWSKWYLGLGTLEAGQLGLLAVLMLSSLLSLVYLLEIPVRAYFGTPLPIVHGDGHGGDPHPDDGKIHEAPLLSVIAMVVTAAATLGLFLFPGPLYDLMILVVNR
jgi:multicomponent Na+:H+ antiporter subunit D